MRHTHGYWKNVVARLETGHTVILPLADNGQRQCLRMAAGRLQRSVKVVEFAPGFSFVTLKP